MECRLGNLKIMNSGFRGELTEAAASPTSSAALLLLVSFAHALVAGDRNTTGRVSQPQRNVAEVLYRSPLLNDSVQLRVHYDRDSHPDLDLYHFYWSKPPQLDTLQDAFDLGGDSVHWYGGPNLMELQWPINKTAQYPLEEYVLNDIFLKYTSGQERYWLSSAKVAVHVPWDVPLWSSVRPANASGEAPHPRPHLLLQSRLKGSQFLSRNDHLEYTIAADKHGNLTLREFHLKCFAKFLKAPTGAPDTLVMRKPIWSTWAMFGKEVNQQQVEDYALELKRYGMPISQLELDDKWTTTYGDYEIDTHKFPNFTSMVHKLKATLGARLTAWVHPFVNADSANGRNLELRDKIFVKTRDGAPGKGWWWDCTWDAEQNGTHKKVEPGTPCAYVVDFTNPEARDWFRSQLKRMQEAGIYAFKFDAGENNWLPRDYTLHSGDNPHDFGIGYAHFAAEFGPAVENRFGSNSQDANIFMRTMDRSSYWDKSSGREGGLSTLIPWVLQASLHGYFFNLPDMIGGNGLKDGAHPDLLGHPPDEELYLRWTQTNTFLLAMQFSYPPWHPVFDQQKFRVLENVKRMLALRDRWMPYILEQVHWAVQHGEPVIRPMWWASDHPLALGSTDQYMVGWKLLHVVAPVLRKGQTQRDIFLPPGLWRDGNRRNSRNIRGNSVVKDYKAPLDTIPFFYRADEEPTAAELVAPIDGPPSASMILVLVAVLLIIFALLVLRRPSLLRNAVLNGNCYFLAVLVLGTNGLLFLLSELKPHLFATQSEFVALLVVANFVVLLMTLRMSGAKQHQLLCHKR